MTEHITPASIANAIMLDTTYSNFYALVEGVKDSKLFRKFFHKDNVRIKETFGCDKLRECKAILEQRGYLNFFGIIDRDFHEILGTTPIEDNLFIVDHHDMEVMMVNSTALDNMLSVFTTHEKISSFESTKRNSLLNIVFEIACNIGSLKLANRIYDLGLVFKPEDVNGNQIAYNKFISVNLDFLGVDIMVDKIIDYSRNKSDDIKPRDEIISRYNEVKLNNYNRSHLSNGHDISNILYIFLKKTMKCNNKMLADFNSIEDSLILAYEFEDFQMTSLYNDIEAFASRNAVQIFR